MKTLTITAFAVLWMLLWTYYYVLPMARNLNELAKYDKIFREVAK